LKYTIVCRLSSRERLWSQSCAKHAHGMTYQKAAAFSLMTFRKGLKRCLLEGVQKKFTTSIGCQPTLKCMCEDMEFLHVGYSEVLTVFTASCLEATHLQYCVCNRAVRLQLSFWKQKVRDISVLECICCASVSTFCMIRVCTECQDPGP
jgi:hypothetical protein